MAHYSLGRQGNSEVILHSFDQLHFGEHPSNHSIIAHIFDALVQSGGDDPVGMDSWSSEQEIIRCVSVDDVTCYFWFQVSNLASETNLAQRVTTPSIEAIDGYSYGLQHA